MPRQNDKYFDTVPALASRYAIYKDENAKTEVPFVSTRTGHLLFSVVSLFTVEQELRQMDEGKVFNRSLALANARQRFMYLKRHFKVKAKPMTVYRITNHGLVPGLTARTPLMDVSCLYTVIHLNCAVSKRMQAVEQTMRAFIKDSVVFKDVIEKKPHILLVDPVAKPNLNLNSSVNYLNNNNSASANHPIIEANNEMLHVGLQMVKPIQAVVAAVRDKDVDKQILDAFKEAMHAITNFIEANYNPGVASSFRFRYLMKLPSAAAARWVETRDKNSSILRRTFESIGFDGFVDRDGGIEVRAK